MVERTASQAPGNLRLEPGKAMAWGEDWRFHLKLAVPSARKLQQDKAFWFAPRAALTVRPARAGERLPLFGRAQGSKLLRDILAESGVPAWQREHWPVIEAQGRVVALPPWRRGRGLDAVAGRKALQLTWESAAGALAGQP